LLASVGPAGSSTHNLPKGRPRTLLHDQPIARGYRMAAQAYK